MRYSCLALGHGEGNGLAAEGCASRSRGSLTDRTGCASLQICRFLLIGGQRDGAIAHDKVLGRQVLTAHNNFLGAMTTVWTKDIAASYFAVAMDAL